MIELLSILSSGACCCCCGAFALLFIMVALYIMFSGKNGADKVAADPDVVTAEEAEPQTITPVTPPTTGGIRVRLAKATEPSKGRNDEGGGR